MILKISHQRIKFILFLKKSVSQFFELAYIQNLSKFFSGSSKYLSDNYLKNSKIFQVILIFFASSRES